MSVQRFNLSSFFPPITDIAQARKKGYPSLTIQYFFTVNLGTFQAFVDYQNDEYVIKYRGYLNGNYFPSWQLYSHSPYQKYILQSFEDLILDALDPNPLLEVTDVLCSQISD